MVPTMLHYREVLVRFGLLMKELRRAHIATHPLAHGPHGVCPWQPSTEDQQRLLAQACGEVEVEPDQLATALEEFPELIEFYNRALS